MSSQSLESRLGERLAKIKQKQKKFAIDPNHSKKLSVLVRKQQQAKQTVKGEPTKAQMLAMLGAKQPSRQKEGSEEDNLTEEKNEMKNSDNVFEPENNVPLAKVEVKGELDEENKQVELQQDKVGEESTPNSANGRLKLEQELQQLNAEKLK